MSQGRFSRFFPLTAVFVLLLLLAATTSIVAAQVPAAEGVAAPEVPPGAVQGFVTDPYDVGVQSAWVHIIDASGQEWMGTATNADGYYAITNLPPGYYQLRAFPPANSTFAGSLPSGVDVASGQWSAVNLALTRVSIGGKVYDCDAIPRTVAGARASVYLNGVEQWDETTSSGTFKIGGLVAGLDYSLRVEPPPNTLFEPMEPMTVTPVILELPLCLSRVPTSVVGLVQDPAGNPVPDARVEIYSDMYWDRAQTGDAGQFALYDVPPGEYIVQAQPPLNAQGLAASEPVSATVVDSSVVVDVGVLNLLTATKTVAGHVYFEGTTEGVPQAMVWAYRLDEFSFATALTLDDGSYELSLTAGEWELWVEPRNPNVPWFYDGPAVWLEFTDDSVPEWRVVDWGVTHTDAYIMGQVGCPGGPCSNDLTPDAVYVSLENDQFWNGASLNSDFVFRLPVVHGWYELSLYVDHPFYVAPDPIQVYVGSGQTLDVGQLLLRMRDATITGQVLYEGGLPAGGVQIVAWQDQGYGWGITETNSSGTYTLPVVGGSWFVVPAPVPGDAFVYTGEAILVRVPPGGTTGDVNFEITRINALAHGVAVDAASGQPLWGQNGWAWAERYKLPDGYEFFSDAPLENGAFDLGLNGGHNYRIGVDLPPQAPYVSGMVEPVHVEVGEEVTVVVPLEAKDAAIAGYLYSAGAGRSEEAVYAGVFGYDERGHWASGAVDMDTGEYWLDVVSGTWHVRAWIAPETGYVAPNEPAVIEVASGEVVTHAFPVWPMFAELAGTVFEPDGGPANAYVYVHGMSAHVGYYETYVRTNADGTFDLYVPDGRYTVGAALPPDELELHGWLNPPVLDNVLVTSSRPQLDLAFQFLELDGEISGTISFTSGLAISPTHDAYVWAWADSGEWAETMAWPVTGTPAFSYTLDVISGTVWHVGAVYEDRETGVYYESAEAVVAVEPPAGQTAVDLVLAGPYDMPSPATVSFDAGTMQNISLPGGVDLTIPAGAVALSGTLTLYMQPTQEVRPDATHTFVGPGYELRVVDEEGQEITQFRSNVMLSFSYPADPILAALGVDEESLRPVYYSTLQDKWLLADSYAVDTDQNVIQVWADHFTKWNKCSIDAGGATVYLPLVVKQYLP